MATLGMLGKFLPLAQPRARSGPSGGVRGGVHHLLVERSAMDLPTSTFAVAVVVALVVPGVVYIGTRAALTGYRGTDKALGSKLAEAVTVSVVLDAAYLVLLQFLPVAGVRFVPSGEQVLVTDPLPLGLEILGFAFAGPALLALTLHAVPWRRLPRPAWFANLIHRAGPVAINRVPTAWDFAARSLRSNFVRIRRSDGTIVGGWYGDASYLSGYPEERDLFVQEQYVFDEEGSFIKAVDRSAGLWISVRDDDIIEWLH